MHSPTASTMCLLNEIAFCDLNLQLHLGIGKGQSNASNESNSITGFFFHRLKVNENMNQPILFDDRQVVYLVFAFPTSFKAKLCQLQMEYEKLVGDIAIDCMV